MWAALVVSKLKGQIVARFARLGFGLGASFVWAYPGFVWQLTGHEGASTIVAGPSCVKFDLRSTFQVKV